MATQARDISTTGHRARLLAGVPVAERRLRLAGIDTPVLEGGDGSPVVLLHGPGGNGAHWVRTLPNLVTTHRPIAPDLPGQGESQLDGVALDAETVLTWLDELIAATCETPPTVVGYGLGGAIAARFAAAHPDRLGRLVLVDTLGLVPLEPAPDFGAALHGFLEQPNADTHERLWRHCARDLDGLRARMGERWDAFESYNLDRARTPAVAEALGALMAQFGGPSIPREELARISVPTSLIWGRHDLATRLEVAESASARYDWPLHVVEDCADDPPVEQPEAFLRALRAELELRPAVTGSVLVPGAAGFGEATRLWNGMIEKRPALVVQPAGTEDVVRALRFARASGIALSVRGGGHNIAGTALVDGGLTLDMSRLRRVAVDPKARTATVQPGCLLQDVDRATQAHGLATPLGFVSDVGVAGLTLGGGLGYLTRRFGWTVDNLLEVEIVTADGRVRRAAPDEHPDLFWAVRGAGANLGVVTRFTFRLHEVGPTVHGGLIAWPFERAGEILRAYRDLTESAPRELSVWLVLMHAPPAPFVPPDWHGRRVCAMSVCYSGDVARAGEVLRPVRTLGEPVFDLLRDQPYVELQSHLDGTEPKGDHYYWKTEFVERLDDGLLDAARELAADCPIPHGDIGFLHLGGALNERPGEDGAVGNRDARYAVGVKGAWLPEDPRGETFVHWVRTRGERIRRFSTGGNYINFQTADEGDERIRATYGANFDRLRAVKAKYDPDNVFASNRNVAM